MFGPCGRRRRKPTLHLSSRKSRLPRRIQILVLLRKENHRFQRVSRAGREQQKIGDQECGGVRLCCRLHPFVVHWVQLAAITVLVGDHDLRIWRNFLYSFELGRYRVSHLIFISLICRNPARVALTFGVRRMTRPKSKPPVAQIGIRQDPTSTTLPTPKIVIRISVTSRPPPSKSISIWYGFTVNLELLADKILLI